MEDEFEKLRRAGYNDVDHLIQWMKDSNVIDRTKAAEDKAKSLLKSTKGDQKVDLAAFNEAVKKLAVENKKSVDDIKALLVKGSATGKHVAGALGKAASTFQDEMKKKK